MNGQDIGCMYMHAEHGKLTGQSALSNIKSTVAKATYELHRRQPNRMNQLEGTCDVAIILKMQHTGAVVVQQQRMIVQYMYL